MSSYHVHPAASLLELNVRAYERRDPRGFLISFCFSSNHPDPLGLSGGTRYATAPGSAVKFGLFRSPCSHGNRGVIVLFPPLQPPSVSGSLSGFAPAAASDDSWDT